MGKNNIPIFILFDYLYFILRHELASSKSDDVSTRMHCIVFDLDFVD